MIFEIFVHNVNENRSGRELESALRVVASYPDAPFSWYRYDILSVQTRRKKKPLNDECEAFIMFAKGDSLKLCTTEKGKQRQQVGPERQGNAY